ncbi:hypothetical protein H4I95_03982 [Botrytis cinerea]
MTETSGSIKEGKEGRMGKIIGSKASGNREKEEIKQGWLRVGEQAYAWWNKSAEERAIITEKQRATRKERFVKNGRLPEIKRRQGERYRATVAAKTEEERRAPIEMQKAWLAGRTPFLSHSALPPPPLRPPPPPPPPPHNHHPSHPTLLFFLNPSACCCRTTRGGKISNSEAQS